MVRYAAPSNAAYPVEEPTLGVFDRYKKMKKGASGCMSTGSGAGVPLVAKSTISSKIRLQGTEAVGVGKFGEVRA